MVKNIYKYVILGFTSMVLTTAVSAQTGSITGKVIGPQGAIQGVTVVVNETGDTTVTDIEGYFQLSNLPEGIYNLTLALGENIKTVTNVEVKVDKPTELTIEVPWELTFLETITVVAASRRRERIVDAPASVVVITEEEIEGTSSSGQMPKVFEFAPGINIAQSGLYDFNVNTRGFNSSLNRRMPVIIDGRDPYVPFLHSMDWPSLSNLEEIASIEIVKGPSSALYGTNAFNGIVNVTTKQPRFSPGGYISLSAGNLLTYRGSARWGGKIGGNWYGKIHASLQESDDFSKSRNETVEYPGIPKEAIPLAQDKIKVSNYGARLDSYFGTNDNALTIEGGNGSLQGVVIQTGIGRFQITDQKRPWARLNFNTPTFNLLIWYTGRDAPGQLSLQNGTNVTLFSDVWSGEIQYNGGVGAGGFYVIGASYREEKIDSRGTLTASKIKNTRSSVFGQFEYLFGEKTKLVLAGRYDTSDVHSSQISPKVGITYSLTPNQTIRLTYNQAFQSPSFQELYLQAPALEPLDLSRIINIIEIGAGLPPGSLSFLGFNYVPVMAMGNVNLDVEKIRTIELGYSGILGEGKAYLTIDIYRSKLTDFVTDLLPGVNPDFPFYTFPEGVPPAIQEIIISTLLGLNPIFAGLTNTPDGRPMVVISYKNAGEAVSSGVDVSLSLYLSEKWTIDASYGWLNVDVKSKAEGDILFPNAPDNRFALTLRYSHDKLSFQTGMRFVDDHLWASGIFFGLVPQYVTVNMTGSYSFSEKFKIGVNISNIFDNKHWETFGGDVMGILALGYLKWDF